jgi:hypothetical protein
MSSPAPPPRPPPRPPGLPPCPTGAQVLVAVRTYPDGSFDMCPGFSKGDLKYHFEDKHGESYRVGADLGSRTWIGMIDGEWRRSLHTALRSLHRSASRRPHQRLGPGQLFEWMPWMNCTSVPRPAQHRPGTSPIGHAPAPLPPLLPMGETLYPCVQVDPGRFAAMLHGTTEP